MVLDTQPGWSACLGETGPRPSVDGGDDYARTGRHCTPLRSLVWYRLQRLCHGPCLEHERGYYEPSARDEERILLGPQTLDIKNKLRWLVEVGAELTRVSAPYGKFYFKSISAPMRDGCE